MMASVAASSATMLTKGKKTTRKKNGKKKLIYFHGKKFKIRVLMYVIVHIHSIQSCDNIRIKKQSEFDFGVSLKN